ncbi:hypothetical protein [Streptomyces antimicrobicus]|uniref:Uncharacterized protein n=1 Tax=Streptomyces antimicrobicus TaxID=2883108 RepID=A0ABS8BBB2_9ACTN|nr:hypothetical protein [Streptomyces antimicrobicus]MCB5181882.1 hypothetical protein [Streptomyces antimicrobicus]
MFKQQKTPAPREWVLAILGAVTLGVAVLSVAVTYQILEPRFGVWAVPTVGALDALWCVFLATEILAGNHRARARRAQYAGLVLTILNAAIPTADLIMNRADGFELSVVLTPIAIAATKLAWWITLLALGRRTSASTRTRLDDKRREVADRLEEMEAEAAHRIELLRLATELEQQVAEAETEYRVSVLAVQQRMTEELHRQAEVTAQTVAAMTLPASVASIRLPELGQWTPAAPALPGTVQRDGRIGIGTQVSTTIDTPGETPSSTAAHPADRTVTLADLSAVAGVPVPMRGVTMSNEQIDVVLRHLRYSDDPPLSYRQAQQAFRRAGYRASGERVRLAWADLMANEDQLDEEDEDDRDDAAV